MLDATLTLLITRPTPPTWPMWETNPPAVNIFLLAEGTRLVNHPFDGFPPGKRFYCAHSFQGLHPPCPVTTHHFTPGGLANLGEMVGESQRILSHPHTHPAPTGQPGIKNIGVLLDKETQQRLEGVRLACGLVGCGHRVVLLGAENFDQLTKELPQASEHLAALAALGATTSRQESLILDAVLAL